MRIAYDAAPLLNPLTGVGHYALTLLEEMLEQDSGIEFELLAVTMRADTSRVPRSERIRLLHRRFPARIAVLLWERLRWPTAETVAGEFDVFHGTNFWLPPLKTRNGVSTIHDLTFLLYPELCTPQIQRYRWIMPRVLSRCALVLTPSETVKRQIAEELAFPEERIVVTPEGIRGTFLDANPDPALLKRLGIRRDFALFIGTQEPRKNLDRLLGAFAKLDIELDLVVVGPQGWGSIDLPAVSQKLHLADRVIFSGYLPDPQLAALMASACCFVFPSLYEGFGLPPLEAMAAGVPVVASAAGSLPEVLGDAPFWCDPYDEDSIADAIQTAATDEELRAVAIQRGSEQAQRYSWTSTARLTIQAYQEVAKGLRDVDPREYHP